MLAKEGVFVHPTARVEPGATLGPGTRVWQNAQVREEARVGRDCIIGKDVYIDRGVIIGDRVKIQNSANIFRGVVIEDEVFIGPGTTFTNDPWPRVVGQWTVVPTIVERGASLGANCTIICGTRIGAGAMVGAGAVVTRDVPAGMLAYGNPARVRGPACRATGSEPVLRVLLIGCGAMGRHYLRHLRQRSGVELVAVIDPRRAELREIASDLPWDDHYRSWLERAQAAIIATPASTHAAIAADCLEAGLHLLVEKPLAHTARDGARLVESARTAGRVLQVGLLERYNPGLRLLRSLLQLRTTYSISFRRLSPYSPRGTDVGIIHDLMIHDLDLAHWLTGHTLEGLTARGRMVRSSLPDLAVVVGQAGPVAISLEASRLAGDKIRTIQVQTAEDLIEYDGSSRQLTSNRVETSEFAGTGPDVAYQQVSTSRRMVAPAGEPLTAAFDDFVRAVLSGGEPEASGASSLPALVAADCLHRQLVNPSPG